MSLSIGHITYANCIPWFHFLRQCGFDGEIVDGVPAELNRLLASGDVDICPSSSIEYARHPDDYLLLPGHSISSIGPVESVLLFSPVPLSALNGVSIAITGESATSVALLQVLLKEFIRLDDVVCSVPEIPVEDVIAQGGPALLIGDRALKMSGEGQPAENIIDLGALWHHFTGLPFVFALWTVRREVARQKGAEVAEFVEQLDASRSRAFKEIDEVVQSSTEVTWMGEERLLNYLTGVSYDLDLQHLTGLTCFYSLLEKHGLIETAPEPEFIQT
jgi:chorismate dehydratase